MVPTGCILSVGTVLTGCILTVGTVPTRCILTVGTVPTDNHSHVSMHQPEGLPELLAVPYYGIFPVKPEF